VISRRERGNIRPRGDERWPLGRQAAKGRKRQGKAGRALEDRNRQQLYELAKQKNIPGRSKMGKWDLIKAIRKAR
jgi:Rho termination factor, N-terminal domain